MSDVLRLEGVGKTYAKDGPAPVTVLDRLDLTVARGEVVALVARRGPGNRRCCISRDCWTRPMRAASGWPGAT